MSLILDNVSYVYSQGNAYEKKALDGINLKIEDGEFIGIIGHTGSGKSTLIQHLNGLLKATDGKIYFDGEDIYDKDYELRDLRMQVGMVFQYPEHQLFDETVFKDVCFGPRNQGLPEKDVQLRGYEALKNVGLNEKYFDVSPFELSGGQKRRAAIAGVIAMKPRVLILDEPTAGLDPRGKDEILDMIAANHQRYGNTVILVSHSMEDVAKYVDRIIVMDDGKIKYDDEPREVFKYYKELEKIGLAAPQVTYLMNDLRENGYPVSTDVTTVDEAKSAILKLFKIQT
ncbi:MAG: energy-coupling factor transporter ATPase [Lachnospiraceae bacterium]|nr:energy-coupling factor transporter ATPase [Lachnospiraceae bacterium]